MNLKMRLVAKLLVGLFVGTAPAGWTHATKQPLKQEKLEGGPAATAARADITFQSLSKAFQRFL